MIRTLLLLAILLLGICMPAPMASPFPPILPASDDKLAALHESSTLRNGIEAMKNHRRGPFKRIRWFCNDGAILPPKAYACREHGGGVQHGEWTEEVKHLRQHNFLIGNLLADLSRENFFAQSEWEDQLKQIILEQFLREADDGWIFRRARYYRGAIQTEDENWHGRDLLLGLLQQPELLERHFLLLREAVRFLPHGQNSPPLTAMRQLAQTLEEQDPGFTPLRIKLHNRPEAADASSVRLYAESAPEELQNDFQQLAQLIDEVSRPQSDPFHEAQLLQFSEAPENKAANMTRLKPTEFPDVESFSKASQLLVKIRTELPNVHSENRQLQWLDLSNRLEFSLYRTANRLLTKLPGSSRRQRLVWIKQGIDALYGTGMLSQREKLSLQNSLKILLQTPVSSADYQREVTQLTHLSRWAENRLRYYFGVPIKRLVQLDMLAPTFVPEQLRGSPLLPISKMIDSLQADSQRLRGVSHQLFGTEVSGMTPLNPGLASGRLEIVADPQRYDYSAKGIYLLPETVEDLPPVAGILTRVAGNSLSHIQLLARNLGIPNVAINNQLQAKLSTHQGEKIRVAVSPGGNIRIDADIEQRPQTLKHQETQTDLMIDPDLQKLDLQQTNILGLEQLRATDSGRIAGPKGANLGELKQFYPQLVPDALVIPFGRFRQFLEQTPAAEGLSLFAWMRHNYQQLRTKLDAAAQTKFLARLRQRITSAPFEPEFLDELHAALRVRFGTDGSYGVFVRSDTNVEDLPNFSGAGLNKTVPNVVGFANILAAIRTVWASPFTERAFSWRQAHMRTPEQLYVSVVLMLSVPADKSGVMATTDLATGESGSLQIAVNEGVGGAVSGQRSEEILIEKHSGQIRLLAQVSAAHKLILLPQGGVTMVRAAAPEQLLSNEELRILRQMGTELPTRFPALRNLDGSSKPADIEFGFLNGRFVLFQIRPLVESKRVQKDLLLQQLDAELISSATTVELDQVPEGAQP